MWVTGLIKLSQYKWIELDLLPYWSLKKLPVVSVTTQYHTMFSRSLYLPQHSSTAHTTSKLYVQMCSSIVLWGSASVSTCSSGCISSSSFVCPGTSVFSQPGSHPDWFHGYWPWKGDGEVRKNVEYDPTPVDDVLTLRWGLEEQEVAY